MICPTIGILLSCAEMRLNVKHKDLIMHLIPEIYVSAAGQDSLKNRGKSTIAYVLVVLKNLIITAREHGDTKKIVFGNHMIFLQEK